MNVGRVAYAVGNVGNAEGCEQSEDGVSDLRGIDLDRVLPAGEGAI